MTVLFGCGQVRLVDGFNQTVCVTGELLPYIVTVQVGGWPAHRHGRQWTVTVHWRANGRQWTVAGLLTVTVLLHVAPPTVCLVSYLDLALFPCWFLGSLEGSVTPSRLASCLFPHAATAAPQCAAAYSVPEAARTLYSPV